MDFSALRPLPAPLITHGAPAVLDGPGSVGPQDLLKALGVLLERSPGHRHPGSGSPRSDEVPALVVGTSGSTGRPKRTVLTVGALRASGLATEEATGTPGGAHWLLALPVHYVAGAQVLARSMLAGTTPVTTASMTPGTRFTAPDFLEAVDRLPPGPRMTSLVPTQVHTLLEDMDAGRVPAEELLEALGSFSAILLGGAPASADLLARCRDLGIPLVLTYGSAETAGGCVYDGSPLPGTRVALDAERVLLGGPTLAAGYLEDPERTAASFRVDPEGTRWYRTDDVGRLRPDGTLEITGRVDDVVITGGLKVSAGAVARELESDAGVREALVVALPDPRWGQAVAAAVSHLPGRHPDPASLREAVAAALGPAAAPKTLLVLEDLPVTTTGKPDRAAVGQLLVSAHASG